MNRNLLLLAFLILSIKTFGQNTQIVITSSVLTDRTFHKKKELLLENCVTKYQIIYTIDTVKKTMTSKEYLIETFRGVWDMDTIIKRQIKQKHKKWKHEIPQSKYESLLVSLNTNIDSLNKDMTLLHTSHHYMNIYIDIINKTDTISYSKTKPFEYLTPWDINKPPYSILNPSIDIQITELLPEEFLGRGILMFEK